MSIQPINTSMVRSIDTAAEFKKAPDNTKTVSRSPKKTYSREILYYPLNDVVDNCYVENSAKKILDKYMNEGIIKSAVHKNPNIKKILASESLTPKIEMKNITGKAQEHFITTYESAKKLADINKLNPYERKILLKASLLHDIGKSLIPGEILNKPGKLTPEERKIVDMHAQLGAEILKTTELPQKVSNVVGLHHTTNTNPAKSNDSVSQMLSAADVESALLEKRAYRPPMSRDLAYDIMLNNSNVNNIYADQLFPDIKAKRDSSLFRTE
ncbi:MAG: HD domain-containing protein [Candidatus Gastranaerophilales bacterium]|nr:HD domain-containing protein [Candidatus Gastranaerophilales bacterium]